MIDFLRAEIDARTLYHIACAREAHANATREDVDAKAIALRNWNAVMDLIAAAMNGANAQHKPTREADSAAPNC